MTSRFSCGSKSITGNFRENNEDRCAVDAKSRFFLVADGMGGQAAGEKASEMAIDLVSQKLDKLIDFESSPPELVVEALDEAVSFANQQIIRLSEDDPTFHNMGTTLTFLVAVGETLYAGGIGDSRVYLLRDGTFDQLTTDHSLTQALVDAGTITPADAESHRYRNVLYRYLGTREGSTGTEPKQIPPRPGDRYMLCSDGVTDGLKDEPLQKLLEENDDPQQAADAIVAAAEAGGSRDNITCVVVHVN